MKDIDKLRGLMSEHILLEMSEDEFIDWLNKSFEYKHHPDDMYFDQKMSWIGEHATFMIMFMEWENKRGIQPPFKGLNQDYFNP